MLKETLLKFFNLDGLINNATGYLEARIELVKLELKDDLARVISSIAVLAAIALLLFLFFLFISFTVAFVLADSLGMYPAFAIVGGFYFLLTVVLLIFKDSISNKIETGIKKSIKAKQNESGD